MSKSIGADLEYLTENDLKKNYIPLLPTKTDQQDNQQLDYYIEVESNSSKRFDHVVQLTKKNPFVPLGCLVTGGVLLRGIFAMKQKDRAKSQLMMRYRVAAQGLTILALIAGTMIAPYFAKD